MDNRNMFDVLSSLTDKLVEVHCGGNRYVYGKVTSFIGGDVVYMECPGDGNYYVAIDKILSVKL